jgi:hypothetical protein
MKRVIMGIVDTPEQAEGTIERLRALGFTAGDVSVLFPDKRGPHDFAFEPCTKAPEGAIAGVVLGAVVGAMLGMAAGVGVLVLPGFGALVASGPLIAGLAVAAALAFLLGAAGAIVGARVPEIEAKHYEGKLVTGSILLAVHVESAGAAARAKEIFRAVSASDVTATSEAAIPVRGRADAMG